MSYEDILGLMIGLGVLTAVIGYLADAYFRPRDFHRLDVPRDGKASMAAFAKLPPSRRRTA